MLFVNELLGGKFDMIVDFILLFYFFLFFLIILSVDVVV
jgi:hypothetical protein